MRTNTNYQEKFKEKREETIIDTKEQQTESSAIVDEPESTNDDQEQNIPAPPEPKTAVVNKGVKLNLRSIPSKEGKVIQVLNPGDSLIVYGVSDEWASVVTTSGIEGYVMIEYVKEI